MWSYFNEHNTNVLLCDHVKRSPAATFSIWTSLTLLFLSPFTFLLRLLLFHVHSEYLLSYIMPTFSFSKLLPFSEFQISLKLVFFQDTLVLVSLICIIEHWDRWGDGHNTTEMAVSESVIKVLSHKVWLYMHTYQ